MSGVQEECELGAGIDEVWKVVGDFGGFLDALGVPVELQGDGIGQTRRISLGSEPTVERLEERDEAAKRLVYSIVSGPFPLSNYRSTMQLGDAGAGRTRLAWSSTFQPAPGTPEDEACGLVLSIYQGGIAGLQRHFGA